MLNLVDTEQTVANDVWGSLTSTIGDYFRTRSADKTRRAEITLQSQTVNAQRDIALAQTRAAPSGLVESWMRNPMPGFFSAYPQADTKPMVSGGAAMPVGLGWLLLLVGGVLLFVFMRR
jgi:hypothetical protein